MIQIIETSDYVNAVTSYHNGCSFKAYVEEDDVKIGYGCYCLVNLKTGAEKLFINAIEANKEHPVSIKQFNNQDHFREVQRAILMVNPFCRHCEGSVLVKMNPTPNNPTEKQDEQR